jgi:FMN-dependent NADH-azoreductase
MQHILLVDSSPRGAASFSRKLSNALIEKLKAKHPKATVRVRDLTVNPTPHLEESHLAALFSPPEKHSEKDKLAIRHSDTAIAEIMAADTIVIGVPMYNFSIPSVLKAWIDHIARAGHTFRYTEMGVEGMVKGKKIFLAVATGGHYSEGPMKSHDFTEPYLRAILGFLGMTDVTAFRVEGVAIPAAQSTALEKAIQSIRV